MKQFGGRPIECAVGKELAGDVVNNYCWIHSSYTTWKANENQSDLVFKGRNFRPEMILNRGFRSLVETKQMEHKKTIKYSPNLPQGYGPYPGVETTREDTVNRHHKYYQWVAGMLLFQVRHFFFFSVNKRFQIKSFKNGFINRGVLRGIKPI